MGATASKKSNDKIISDLSIIKIPKNFVMLKIASYTINLKKSINVDTKIKSLVSYITSTNKNKGIDIICLQGVYDVESLYEFIRYYKTYCLENNIVVYFAPNFDHITPDSNTSTSKNGPNTSTNAINSANSRKMATLSFNATIKGNHFDKDSIVHNKQIIQNIIISKYPIDSIIYSELDDDTDMDDILGIQTLIGANIVIENNLISVYNFELCKDIKSAKIINNSVRVTEIDKAFQIINKNQEDISKTKFVKTDIHLICANLNIVETENSNINPEFMGLIEKNQCVDIFRYKFIEEPGYTTCYNERFNYILLRLTSDLYDKSSEFYDKFQKVESIKELLNVLFKRYNIHFIDYNVIKFKGNISYPIECCFILNTKPEKPEKIDKIEKVERVTGQKVTSDRSHNSLGNSLRTTFTQTLGIRGAASQNSNSNTNISQNNSSQMNHSNNSTQINQIRTPRASRIMNLTKAYKSSRMSISSDTMSSSSTESNNS